MNASFSYSTKNATSPEWWTLMVPSAWWVVLLLVLLCIFTIVTNLLIIVTFIREKRVRNPFNYLLLNMAISDFLVGTICIPCSIVYEYYKYWPLSAASCSFYMYFDYTVTNVSIWTLVIVSFDRLWAAQWPLSYREYNNRPKALIGIILSWLIVNATILPGFIYTRMTFGWLTEKERSCSWEHEGLPVFASSFPVSVIDGWLPTPIVVTCYVLTLITIYKRGNITHPEPTAAPNRQVSRNRKRQERQAFWVLTLLVIAQVALWMPWIVYLIRMHLFHYDTSELYIDVAYWLGYSLSAVNPVLFNIGNKDIFNSVKKLFGLKVPVSEGSRWSRATVGHAGSTP